MRGQKMCIRELPETLLQEIAGDGFTAHGENQAMAGEILHLRRLKERMEAVLLPSCPGFEAACRALWEREPHHLLAARGFPVDYDSQPPAIKAGVKRQVLTVLRTISKEVKGE